MEPIIEARETLHEGFTRVLGLTIRLPGGGLQHREVEESGPVVVVLPYDPERRLAMLIRTVRPGPLLAGAPAGGWSLEAPAGYVDEGESVETAARREVLEETGLQVRDLHPVGGGYPSPGRSSERLSLFMAPYGMADRVTAGGGLASEQEALEVMETPLAELWRTVESGGVLSIPTLALVWRLKLTRPELFG